MSVRLDMFRLRHYWEAASVVKPDNVQNHRVAAGDVDFRFGPDRQLRCILLLASSCLSTLEPNAEWLTLAAYRFLLVVAGRLLCEVSENCRHLLVFVSDILKHSRRCTDVSSEIHNRPCSTHADATSVSAIHFVNAGYIFDH